MNNLSGINIELYKDKLIPIYLTENDVKKFRKNYLKTIDYLIYNISDNNLEFYKKVNQIFKGKGDERFLRQQKETNILSESYSLQNSCQYVKSIDSKSNKAISNPWNLNSKYVSEKLHSLTSEYDLRSEDSSLLRSAEMQSTSNEHHLDIEFDSTS